MKEALTAAHKKVLDAAWDARHEDVWGAGAFNDRSWKRQGMRSMRR